MSMKSDFHRHVRVTCRSHRHTLMPLDPNQPYNDLPDLPPPVEIETQQVLRETTRARSLLGELKGYCQTLPNPELLLNVVVLQESKDSSAIENIVTTGDDLYRAFALSDAATPEAREVLRYREAIYTGLREIERSHALTTNVMIRVMQTIKETQANIRTQPGTKLANPRTGTIVYSPPEGQQLIRDRLYHLEEFINAEHPVYDPVVMMALMHYQFEAIHPFTDGNGRTGRILNVLYLVQQDLLTSPILNLSGYIINNKKDYYRLLRRVTEAGEWVDWVLYMVKAVGKTARATLEKIRAIQDLKEYTLQIGRAALPTAPVREIVDLMFSHPYLKIGTLEEYNLAKRQTASRYLHTLASAKLLIPIKDGRDIYFVNHRLIQLFSD